MNKYESLFKTFSGILIFMLYIRVLMKKGRKIQYFLQSKAKARQQ